MKKGPWILVALAALFLASCDNPAKSNGQGDTDNGYSQTFVVFDNGANPFRVDVYSSWNMIPENRMATIAGGERSEAIGFFPNPQGFTFFARYFFAVENSGFSIAPPTGQLGVVIPDGQTTTVNIRPLYELAESPGSILVNRTYLFMKNNDAALIRLLRGTTIVPDTDGSTEIPQQGTAVFNVTPGSASNYQVSWGNNFPFPAGLTFGVGHIHFLEFDGTAVTLTQDPVAITLENAVWGGNGSRDHPFRIDSAETLRRIGRGTGNWHGDWSLSAHYRLTSDIDITGQNWTPIGHFAGTFDGNGRTITGLAGNQGMFDTIGAGGIVRNLTLENVDIDNDRPSAILNVGGVAGQNFGMVESVYVNGLVSLTGGRTGVSVGGVVGRNRDTGTVRNGHVSANVRGYAMQGGYGNIGGVAGWNEGSIKNSSVGGYVSLAGLGGVGFDTFIGSVGGAVGRNQGTVENIAIVGNVTVTSTVNRAVVNMDASVSVGGVVGHNLGAGTVENSYFVGSVLGAVNVNASNSVNHVGGVVGWNTGTVQNSIALNYSADAVGGTIGVGRMVGTNDGTIGENRAWNNMLVNGSPVAGGTGAATIHGANLSGAEAQTQNVWLDAGFAFAPYGPWRWMPYGMPQPSWRSYVQDWPDWLD